MSRRTVTLAILFLLLAAPCLAAASHGAVETSEAVLNSQGEIYQVVAGPAETILGDGWGIEPGNPVLALQIRKPNSEIEVQLLPGTQGPSEETSASLSFDVHSETLYVTWEERVNYIHSQVRIAAFKEGEWSEPISVSDQRLSLKFSPRVVVTRDSFHEETGDAEVKEVRRTILHMVWLEERGEGPVAVYSPLVLLDGVVAGPNPRFVLTDLVRPSEDAIIPALPTRFSPAIALGNSDHSVVVGFFDPWTEALVSFQIAALPGDLSRIAQEVERFLLDEAPSYDMDVPDDVQKLGDRMRGHMIDIGARMDPELLGHIAGGMRGHMIDIGVRHTPDSLPTAQWIADEMRGHMIDIGFRLDDRGLRSLDSAEAGQVVDILPQPGPGIESVSPSGDPTPHVAEIRRLASWPVPPGLDEGFDTAFLARDGKTASLVRELEHQLLYIETEAEGWSPVRRIRYQEGVDAEQARRMITNRLGNH